MATLQTLIPPNLIFFNELLSSLIRNLLFIETVLVIRARVMFIVSILRTNIESGLLFLLILILKNFIKENFKH